MPALETAACLIELLSYVVTYLQETADGIGSSRFFGGSRFQRKLEDYCADLSTQKVRLVNNLLAIIRASDVLPLGELDPARYLEKLEITELFRTPELTKQFEVTLGEAECEFLQRATRIESVLAKLKQEREVRRIIEQPGVAKASTDDYKDRARRIKQAYDAKKHECILSDLKQINNDFDSIQKSIADFEPPKKARNERAGPLQQLRKLRNNAKELFSNLICASQWNCLCAKEHAFLLKVKSAHEQEDRDIEIFNVGFVHSQDEWDHSKSRGDDINKFLLRRTVKSDTCELPTEHSEISVTTENGSLKTLDGPPFRLRATRVRFAEGFDREPHHKTVPQRSKPNARRIELTDFCQFFMQPPLPDNSSSWFIGAANMSSSILHEVQPFPPTYQFHKASLLSTIKDFSCHCKNCDTPELSQLDLSISDRLSMAAVLAASAFQLQGNWLALKWSNNDMLMRISSDESSIYSDELHVIAMLRQDRDLIDEEMPNRALSESLLEPLGIALAEVLLSRRIASGVNFPTTKCSRTPALSIQEALKRLYSTYGRQPNSIGNAVSQCLCWSGPVSHNGFDDPAFSSAAFEKVIWPITENHLIFEGKTDAAAPSGSHGYGNTTLGGQAKAVLGNVYGDVHYNYLR